MKKFGFTLKGILLFTVLLLASTLVQGAAVRTWVSQTTGDDINPCSRTAPCMTFAGAISKTNEGGEIDVLDPGAYGAVTINKAITIDGGTGAGWASILTTGGTTGITVDITGGAHVDDAEVILRNLTLNGARQAGNGGAVGIKVIHVFQLHLENINIEDFDTTGIDIAATDTVKIWLQHMVLSRDVTAVQSTSTSGIAVTYMDDVSMQGNTNGLKTLANSFSAIRNSFFAGNGGATNGAVKAASGCTINVENSMFVGNTTAVNSAAGGVVNISNDSFYGNTTALTGAGTIATATNSNKFAGNTSDGSTNGTITLK